LSAPPAKFAAVRFTNVAKSEVEIHTKDITIRFDGQRVTIRISPFHKHTQCGLCGHFDGDERDEFRNGGNERGESMNRQLHRSYTVQDDEDCSDSQHQTFYQADQFERQDSREGNNQQQKEQDGQSTKKPVKRTRTVESHDKICFSTSKVNECSGGSQPKGESEQTSIEFVCLQRSNIDARRLMRSINSAKRYQQTDESNESEDGAIQQEITELKSELDGSAGVQKFTISVPKQCTDSRRR